MIEKNMKDKSIPSFKIISINRSKEKDFVDVKVIKEGGYYKYCRKVFIGGRGEVKYNYIFIDGFRINFSKNYPFNIISITKEYETKGKNKFSTKLKDEDKKENENISYERIR